MTGTVCFWKVGGGPSGGPSTGSTGVVNGPGSMFCIHSSLLQQLVIVLCFYQVIEVWLQACALYCAKELVNTVHIWSWRIACTEKNGYLQKENLSL